MTRVVLGLPAYGGGVGLTRAMHDLLAQTHRDFNLIVSDDADSAETRERVDLVSRRDERVTLIQNRKRLGLVGNWNEVLRHAQGLHPEAEYFAWASDHDRWEPEWLELLVGALDARQDAVLAYPVSQRHRLDGTSEFPEWRFDTAECHSPRQRLRRCARRMVAGDMIYGLFRLGTLADVGGLPLAVYPDRLTLARLAIRGRFIQVPQATWHRTIDALSVPSKQRKTLFGERAPLRTLVPWWLTHPAAMRGEAERADLLFYVLAGMVLDSRRMVIAAKDRTGRVFRRA